jgi:hypothetical protein
MPVSPELKEFGRKLMEHVRDETIQTCDFYASGGSRYRVSKRWRKAAESGRSALLKEVIPDIVDSALAHLLDAIDEGWLKLTYTAENGKVLELNDCDPGPLAGWLGGGEGGWTTTYSKERFVDDLSHSDSASRF